MSNETGDGFGAGAGVAAVVETVLDPFLIGEALYSPDGLVRDLLIRSVNRPLLDKVGVESAEDVVGKTFVELSPSHAGTVLLSWVEQAISTGEPVSFEDYPYQEHLLGSDRRRYDFNIVPLGGDSVCITFHDVMRSRLRGFHHSFSPDTHDPLTGLANKATQMTRLNKFVEANDSGHSTFAVLSVGVDQLRRVNEGWTYTAGDEVLQIVAERVTDVVGGSDHIGRIAGDEFIVLLPESDGIGHASSVADRICDGVRQPISLSDSRVVTPTVSIGIAFANSGMDAHELLRQATLAMQQAKTEGRDRWAMADPGKSGEATRRLDIEDGIRQALDSNEIATWYQPVVRLQDRAIVGYEALARWVKPDGVAVSPADFVPVAENSSLIVEIDKRVLQHVFETLRSVDDIHIAANLSVATLSNPGFPRWLEDIVADNLDVTARLRLEVTETALIEISAEVRELMRSVAETGVRWYADDFGVGYSSISYLRDLPIGGLKLDMSFTRGLKEGDQQAFRLAQGLAGLARGLNIDTVAEGVESEIQAVLLHGQGWEDAQGWYFGKPAPLPR